MKANVEKIHDNVAELKIEVEAEEVNKAIDRAYRKLVKEVNIPGFRKGKAPRKIVENHIGSEPIYNEALDFILPEIYPKAIDETKLDPINTPEINVEQFEEGKPLIIKVSVEVKPEVKLGVYKGLEIEEPTVEVTEKDVEEHLETLQNRYAKIINVSEGAIEKGDIAVIDYKGYIDGQTFAGGIEDNYPLEIGSGMFIEGFEEQLIGAKIGENKDVEVIFPDDYREENLAGKKAVFKVIIKEIKRKELAPLDDEFAKDVSEFETLNELKEDIRNKLKEKFEKNARQEMKDGIIKKVVANSEVDIPETLVNRRIDVHLARLEERLKAEGFDMEQYCEAAETTVDELREKYRDQAVESVKTDLVLEEIANKEKIDVKDDDILGEIEELAKEYNESADKLRKNLRSRDNLEALSYGIMIDKTIKFLMENSKKAGEGAGQETESPDV